jgi:F-type H+-transporting ATPase subunit b
MRVVLTLALMAATALWALAPTARAQEGEAPAAAEHSDAAHGHDDLGHGDASSNLENPAEFRTDLALYTFAVFVLLLAILSRAAWPKISEALLARERRIEESLAAAEAKHEEAKRLLAQHEARLASAAAEVRAMLDEARRDADHTRDEIVAEARAAAQQERERALRDIDTATDHALKNIAETSANLAVELAGKVIRESINPAKQQELVRSALQKLNAGNN